MEPTKLANLAPTPVQWVSTVLEDFPTFLQDHASCEKKASGMALNIASHYPDRPALVNAMAELAVEELSHYREVVRLLTDRGLPPGSDSKDPYVGALNALIRRGSDVYLLDRLLLAAVIERRGHERFAMLAAALPSGADKRFYEAIANSEARHWQLFYSLAERECEQFDVARRLSELVEAEAEIMRQQPLRPALH